MASRSLFHNELVSSKRVIYTPSQFAKEFLFNLQETGTLSARQPHTSRRSNLHSYLFFTVRSGSGILEYNSKKYKLSEGDCIFLDCSRPYAHSTSEFLWELQWIHFNGPTMAGIYQKYINRGGLPVFQPSDIQKIEKLLDKIYKTAKAEDYMRDMKLNSMISELLVFIMKESWHPSNASSTSLKSAHVVNIKEYLDNNYNKKISLDYLANSFYINKYYMVRAFKAEYDVSIVEYLTRIRIDHAKELLRFTESSLADISEQVGYSDVNYFNRVFSKIEGMSPTKYRKSW